MGMLLPDRSGGNLSEVLNIAAVPFQWDTVDTCHTHTNTYPQCLTFTLHHLPHSSFGFRRPSCSPLHLKLQSKREGAKKMKECYAGENAKWICISVCLKKNTICQYIMQHKQQKGAYYRHAVHAIAFQTHKCPSKSFIRKLTSGVFPLLKQEKMANCFLWTHHLKRTP